MIDTLKTACMLLFLAFGALGSPVTKYGATNSLSGVVQDGDTLWITSRGGLVQYLSSEQRVIRREYSDEILPDIELKSPYLADNGDLWFGSEKGYLYRKSKRGRWDVFEDLLSADAAPNTIIPYDDYLIIGHSKGLSVFDIEKERVLYSVSEPGVTGRVFSLLLVEDTLYAGVEKNIVRFDSFSQRMNSFAFRDPDMWSIVDTLKSEVLGLDYYNSSIRGFSRSALRGGNTLVYGNVDYELDITYDSVLIDSIINIDTTKTTETVKMEVGNGSPLTYPLPSAATFISLGVDNIPLITTAQDYLYQNPFEEPIQTKINGPIFGEYQNALLAHNGDLWLATVLEGDGDNDWWRGISRFDGEKFTHYNKDVSGFGSISNADIGGFCTSKDGKIWIGTNGSSVKVWDPESDSWIRYAIKDFFANDVDTVEISTNPYGHGWIKCDEIIQDSSGYMWFSMWGDSNYETTAKHRIVVVDPRTGTFRFFFSRLNSSLNHVQEHFSEAVVDSDGNRIFIDPYSKKRVVIPASINPFVDSVELENTGFFLSEFDHEGVTEMVAAPTGGAILLSGSNGIGLMRNGVKHVTPPSEWVDSSQFYSHYAHYLSSALSVAIEESSVETNVIKSASNFGGADTLFNRVVTTVFWAAFTQHGVERLELKEWIRDDTSFVTLNIYEEPIIITAMDNLDFVSPTTLLIDHERNCLWIASPSGLYRYQLGYEPSGDGEDNSKTRLFPNPYSKSKHELVTLDFLDPNSFVDIYTVSGKLVAHYDQKNSEFFQRTGKGQKIQFRIPDGWAPGTYIVAAKSSETGVTELKKLVVIP